jgi:hypothetical protein
MPMEDRRERENDSRMKKGADHGERNDLVVLGRSIQLDRDSVARRDSSISGADISPKGGRAYV